MGRAEDLFARLEREGEAFIDELIATRKAEEAFLDFKRSETHGATQHLDNKDRANLAAALSGFANSDGGVIVWGVGASQASGDVADAKHPLQDAARFASQIDNAVSGCTVPPVLGARSIAITTGDLKGFAATLIPQSTHGPHQVVGRGIYNIRAGSSFFPATHGVLAGMFGRAPRPKVDLRFVLGPLSITPHSVPQRPSPVLDLTANPLLFNDGATLATFAYLSMRLQSKPCDSCRLIIGDPHPGFCTQSALEGDKTFVLEDGRKLPPRGRAIVTMFRLSTLAPPFTGPLVIHFVFGCDGAAPGELHLRVEAEEFEATYARARESNSPQFSGRSPDLFNEAARLLGSPANWERPY